MSSARQVEQLYRIAESQCGLFTTKQAKAVGYTENNFPHYIRTGSWIREHRGIYRLSRFPESVNSQLVLWSLWSRNRAEIPQAVYSHETALRIHDLSDIMPARLHITVPMAFRRNSDIPAVLVLHRADLHSDDIESMQGFQVARPLRTLVDLIEAQTVSRDFIEQAVKQGLEIGLITRRDIRTYEGHEESIAAIQEYAIRTRP
jgi:predicted transcriptional regulator of viral defense system